MAKGFLIALAAGLVLVPCLANQSAADQSQVVRDALIQWQLLWWGATTSQAGTEEGCEKDGSCDKKCCQEGKCSDGKCKDGQCKDGECKKGECSEGFCKEGKCAAGKCCDKSKCANGDCDKTAAKCDDCACDDCQCADGTSSNCKCSDCQCAAGNTTKCAGKACEHGQCEVTKCSNESCEQADCKCAGKACTACSKHCCKSSDEGCTACDQSDCQSGNCQRTACSEAGCCSKVAGFTFEQLPYQHMLCQTEACCEKGECCKEGGCSQQACHGFADTDLFGASGGSLLGRSVSSPGTAMMDATWQQIGEDLQCVVRGTGRRSGWVDPQSEPQAAVYLILESRSGSDCAIKTQLSPHSTVGSVLQTACLPHPVDFAAAQIEVRRAMPMLSESDCECAPVDQDILTVRWDATTGMPTAGTDHALRPNDRVFVKCDSLQCECPQATAAKYAAVAQPTYVDAVEAGKESCSEAKRICYSIQIVEDTSLCLEGFESLKQGRGMMIAESKTLLPAMQAFGKHDLIKQLSAPKLICHEGQSAELEFEQDPDDKQGRVRLEVNSEKTEQGLQVDLAVHATEGEQIFKVRSRLMLEEGRSVVLTTCPSRAAQGDSAVEPVVYVVLTPEIVK